MRRYLNVAYALLIAGMILVVTSPYAAKADYSIAITTGQLYVQAYTRLIRPTFGLNTSGNASSCQAGHHINHMMWFGTQAANPVPTGGAYTNTWLEAGYIGGYWFSCDLQYYYENHYDPFDPNKWNRFMVNGATDPTNDIWIRFANPVVGTAGVYAIFNGTQNQAFLNQRCCSDHIIVGQELSTSNVTGWSSTIGKFDILRWYDLGWNISAWTGCTSPGFPNDCSNQAQGMTGYWNVRYDGDQSSLP